MPRLITFLRNILTLQWIAVEGLLESIVTLHIKATAVAAAVSHVFAPLQK